MPFSSAEEYEHFARSVKHDRRFIFDASVTRFLDAVQETAESRVEELPSGSIFWRAQRGSQMCTVDEGQPTEDERETPLFEDKMKPLPALVGDGRANPRGVAYLYLASNLTTAGSEVRPWLGAYLSLSQFKTTRNLNIVNCTRDKKRWFKAFAADIGFIPWEATEFENVVWGDIGAAMSRPYSDEEQSLNYVPTQIIAERLRHGGVDGMVYRSLLSENGYNIVLFNVKDAGPINFQLYEVKAVSYTIEPVDNPYFAKTSQD